MAASQIPGIVIFTINDLYEPLISHLKKGLALQLPLRKPNVTTARKDHSPVSGPPTYWLEERMKTRPGHSYLSGWCIDMRYLPRSLKPFQGFVK